MTLALLLAMSVTETFFDAHGRWLALPHWDAAIIPALVAAAEVGVAVALVQQTWRRTRLTVEYNRMALALLSPFQRRRYDWAGADIVDVVLLLTANQETGDPLGEVLITRVAGGDVRLFTDHRAARLDPIVTAVRNVLQTGRSEGS